MNKQHWNTIILSDKCDKELIEELLQQSYELTEQSDYLSSLETNNSNIQTLTDVLTAANSKLNNCKRSCNGIEVVTPAKAGIYYTKRINFPEGLFNSKPVIFLTPITSVPHNVHLGIKEYAKNYFIMTYKRDDAASQTSVHWRAEER